MAAVCRAMQRREESIIIQLLFVVGTLDGVQNSVRYGDRYRCERHRAASLPIQLMSMLQRYYARAV